VKSTDLVGLPGPIFVYLWKFKAGPEILAMHIHFSGMHHRMRSFQFLSFQFLG
jgi:hypothetical protein